MAPWPDPVVGIASTNLAEEHPTVTVYEDFNGDEVRMVMFADGTGPIDNTNITVTLLDDMDNSTDRAYAAHPERLYLIDSEGMVVFQSGPGPFGFDVPGWEEAIEALVQ